VTIDSPDDRRPDPLLSVQMLRAVAATMVLLFHLATTSAYGWLAPGAWHAEVARFVEAIGFAGVDLFFVISGVVMVYSSYDRLGAPREMAPFIKRRVARIYPLYWVCTAAVLALAWMAPNLASREKFSALGILKSFLLWPQDEYPVVAVGWTLTFEMYFYLVFAGMFALPRRALPWALVGWAVITLGLFPLFDQPAYRTSLEGHLSLPLVASPLALEFIAGCFIGCRARTGRMPLGAAALAAGLVTFAAIGGALRMRYPLELHYGIARVAVFGTGAALIAYGCIALEREQKLRVPQLLKLAGDASYSLYLTHMYALWGVAQLWPTSPASGVEGAWRAAMTPVALFACGATAVISYRWIERPLHRYFLLVLGVAPHGCPGRTVAT
jgi:peptidoglycan/LPS O-acetylase OafA/YrhL